MNIYETASVMFPFCMSDPAAQGAGVLRLALAEVCNISCLYCRYCNRVASGRGPDPAHGVPDPDDAAACIDRYLVSMEELRSIWIAGPGEPLIGDRVFTVLGKIRRKHPDLDIRLATNGLLLSDRLGELVHSGVQSIVITIDAVSPHTAARMHPFILYRGRRLSGFEAGETLVRNQWRGLINAIETGLTVVVRTFHLPGINDEDIPRIASIAGSFGAESVHRIILPGSETNGPGPLCGPERLAQQRRFVLQRGPIRAAVARR